MFGFFRSLRGKLTLTYTLVTVLALLAIEVIILAILVAIFSISQADRREYMGDIIYTLSPQARAFLQPGSEDFEGLDSWLQATYSQGKASLEPQGLLDSPAALIVRSYAMYVLSPSGEVLAQASMNEENLVGQLYLPPENDWIQRALDRASAGWFDSLALSVPLADGNYFMAVPVFQEGMNKPVLAVVLVTVAPPPPLIFSVWPILLGAVLVTAALLLVGVAPFGTLFGFIMSRGLTRRLKALTAAADAWSEGNFTLLPQDRSRDELGFLGLRLRHMAERIQLLLHSQQELAAMDERNRLARELHDTVKQQNFATLMQIRAAKNLVSRDADTALKHLEEAEALIKTSQQELGLMIAELRPAALDGHGLCEALQMYLDTWSLHTRVPTNFQVQNERSLSLDVEQALYRVAQEALANVSRHSRASAVTVRLTYDSHKVSLIVIDNGTGFNPAEAGRSGFGLQSMRGRVVTLGGNLEVKSEIGQGTMLTAWVPVR